MFLYLPFEVARLKGVDLKAAATTLKKVAIDKSPKTKERQIDTIASHAGCLTNLLLGEPSWPCRLLDNWGGPTYWELYFPFTPENFAALTPLIRIRPSNIEFCLDLIWPKRRRFAFGQTLKSKHEQVGHYFYSRLSLGLTSNAKQFNHETESVLRAITDVWGVTDLLGQRDGECCFTRERFDFKEGRIVASTGFDQEVDFLSFLSDDDVDAVERLALSSIEPLTTHFGAPRMIRLQLSAFHQATEQCAEYCRSLFPRWYCTFVPKKQKGFDPFGPHAKEGDSTVVVPITWSNWRRDEVDMEDFMDMCLAVEHAQDGTNLLFATNQDAAWLRDVMDTAGFSGSYELLDESYQFASLDKFAMLRKTN